MNAEERPHGKAWVDSVRKELADYDKTVVRVSEIERVIVVLEALQRQAVTCGRIWQIDDAMHLLRSLLSTQRKEGE